MDKATRKKPEPVPIDPAVDRFLQEKIDTVPHLEALLLLWNSRPKTWLIGEMSTALFLQDEATIEILGDLVRHGLIVVMADNPESYRYESQPERDLLIQLVDLTYRQQLVRVSGRIHAKASTAVREFARACRLKKGDR